MRKGGEVGMTKAEQEWSLIESLVYCKGKRLTKKSCAGCPYAGAGCAIDATIAKLKAQEPRVMTLEEVLALKFDDVVYVEVVPTHAVLSAIVLDVIPKLPKIGIGVVQFRYAPTWNGINNADLSYYGKTWRCWTSRPTNEQREATAW